MSIGLMILLTILSVTLGIAITFIIRLKKISINENPAFWEKQVRNIELRYLDKYPKDHIIFTGSSSIENWKTLKQDMSPLNVINHGIAGTKVNDISYYADRLIFPFQPNAIVFYAGANDINGVKNNSKTGDCVYRLTVDFFSKIHEWNPDIVIFYISISPSKARMKVWEEAKRANDLIKAYCQDNKYLKFIDCTSSLINKNGVPESGIFKSDGFHFNKKGYAIWTSIVKPIIENNT